MKKGEKRNPFAVFAVIMLIIAVLLVIILADMTFVPSGEKWEAMRAVFFSAYEEYQGLSDKEIWEMTKNEAVEYGVLPVKSGFLCWYEVSRLWDEEEAEREAHEAELAEANLIARELKNAVNELAETTELSDMYAQVQVVFDDIQYISHMGEYLEDDHPLFACVNSVELNARNASILMVIRGGKCTAAAYLPDVTEEIAWGVDCPNIAEDGTFDLEQPWGSGFSKNGFIIGIA